MSLDAAYLTAGFLLAAAASYSAPFVHAALARPRGRRLAAAERAALLAELAAARERVGSLKSHAVTLVATHNAGRRKARSPAEAGPLPLARLQQSLFKRLAALDAAHFASRQKEGAADRLLAAAGEGDAEVAAAARAVRAAHPLAAPAALLLRLQAQVLEEQAALYARAVQEAHAGGVAVNSEAFGGIVHTWFRAALSGKGEAELLSLAPVVVAREDAGGALAGREGLFLHMVEAGVVAEAEGEAEFAGFRARLEVMFKRYEGAWQGRGGAPGRGRRLLPHFRTKSLR